MQNGTRLRREPAVERGHVRLARARARAPAVHAVEAAVLLQVRVPALANTELLFC